ncbi:hypothetical protein FRC03_012903 [Tulasnella sp. 419]|nr:hypothetical protein FRC03_012903 [Tulasnella sp. 419]
MASADIQNIIPLTFGLAATYGLFKLSKVGSRDSSLPPGPPTVPILGNINIIPTSNVHVMFTEWAKQYGGVYSLKLGNSNLVVLSSLEAINEALESNGANTANRPVSEPMHKMAGDRGLIAFTHYGPIWRTLRRAAADLMKPHARERIVPIHIAESTQLLLDCLDKPDMLFYHLQRYTISTAFSTIGGVRLPQVDSPLLNKWFNLLSMQSKLFEPGNIPPVDLLPILKLIPDRFANNWRARCETCRIQIDEIMDELDDANQKRMSSENPNGCFLELLEQNAQEWNLDHEDIRSIVAALIMGSTISTTPLLHFVVLLATAYPHHQRKIQEEIDQVVGNDRLPTLEDLPKLPYLTVFMKEIHRFRPMAPTGGIPHRNDADIMCQGYLIPKDSTLLLNLWGLNHDPNLFDNPDTFDPERFIRSPYGTKPGLENTLGHDLLKRLELFNFGGGRRRCVGLPLAQSTSNLSPAKLFWAFDFSPALDVNGNEIPPDYNAFDSVSVLSSWIE